MNAHQGAILAVLLLVAAGPLDEPRHVRFQRADGVQVEGEMTSFDDEGFDGSFGRRFWEELAARDAWRLYLGVMNQNDAAQWVSLGRVLLLSADGGAWADRAFRRGIELDASVAPRIEDAREAAAEAQRLRRRLDETAAAERLRELSPEAGPWPSAPWPQMTPAECEAAIEAMKDRARRILRDAGWQARPVETGRAVVYGDGAPIDTARWAMRAESVAARLGAVLGVEPDANLFWCKVVVLLFGEEDRFRLVEAQSFGQLVARQQIGICHPEGEKVFVNVSIAGDPDAAAAHLVHQMVLGLLHRHRSALRLPAWANEGLAEHLAAELTGRAAAEDLRRTGLAFIRAGGDANAALDLTYEDGWPGPRFLAQAVGALLVELMIAQRTDGFRAWVAAVKDGKDWERALADDFGVPRAQLVETFVQYYRVND